MRPLTVLNSQRFFPRPLLPPGRAPRPSPPCLRPWAKLGLGFLTSGGSCFCSRAGSMDAPRVAVKSKIDLTEKEEKIFGRLLEVVEHFRLETELRVAGGWVRDKLLGIECYDIDIALNDMLGREFCEKVNEYMSSKGEERQGVGVIQCNPDQSKHLETARMRIYDTWIDFVNLRSETYVENSRIPSMIFGTAEEDAYRRDLTINSLFYNIKSKSVEDFTGRGVEDLKSGVIVTPLPPKATFLDDPLRVLRAIRFGARFGFILDDALRQAAADEEVKAAITNKISRERIGHEIDLMISDNQPVKAMADICDLQLFWAVFTLPHDSEPTITEGTDRLCVEYMDAAWNLVHSLGYSTFNDDHCRLYLYVALLLPLRKLIYRDKKCKEIPVANYVFRNSLKLKAGDAEAVVSLHGALEKCISLIDFLESIETSDTGQAELGDDFLDIPPASESRVLAGLFLRQIKDLWPVALLISTLLYPKADHIESFLAKNFQLNHAREMYRRVWEIIVNELDLDKVWEVKPLLKGDKIMQALNLTTGGPQIREWQQRLLQWQLAHPGRTEEDAIGWIEGLLNAKRVKLN